MVLDLNLPDMDGMEICRRLRTWSAVPIIVLSVREDESDKVEALDLGADDYLTKPFGIDELLARVRAQLRRAEAKNVSKIPRYVRDGLEIDLGRDAVSCAMETTFGSPRPAAHQGPPRRPRGSRASVRRSPDDP